MARPQPAPAQMALGVGKMRNGCICDGAVQTLYLGYLSLVAALLCPKNDGKMRDGNVQKDA